MKKILVGLLGIFMVLGGALFASCGQNKVDINLSETYKEIVVLDSDNIEPVTITAEVVGISDGRVTATSSQSSIVTASPQYDSSTNTNIITLVPGESEGTATVTVTSFDQSVSKNITVLVHGEVTGMRQGSILSPEGKKYDYAIRGGAVTLNGANLIEFEKTLDTNRTAVTWDDGDGVGYHIEDDGQTLVVDADFVGSEVVVEAISVYNPTITTSVTLQVIDNIDLSNLKMRYSYSNDFGGATDIVEGSVIELTSNIKAGGYKRAHIEFGLSENQNLKITPVVKNQDGLNSDMVTILGDQSPNESANRYFVVEGKDNANLTVNAYFEVGYRDYAYSQKSVTFQVESYLRVESIGVSSQYGDFVSIKEGQMPTLPTQNIYTSYGQGSYGEKFDVQILPIGVADPDADLYYIEVTYPNDLGSQIEFTSQTLQFYYIGVDGVLRQLAFSLDEEKGNMFRSEQLSVDSVSSLYVRANAQEPWQSLSGVQVEFRSVANESASAVGQLNLYHSAESLDFGEVETDVFFASNGMRTETKTLTLYGQSDISGLSVSSNFEHVSISGINLIESNIEENSVTFSFSITMKESGLGLTEVGTYTISHANGLREDYQINLFLPLTSASLGYDISTETNGRTDYDENGLLYLMSEGVLVPVEGSQKGISAIMVKKGLSVLLSGQTNRSSARNAKAEVSIEYVDLSNENYQDEESREAFRNLTPNEVLGRELSTIGGIVSINDNSSISGQFNFTMTALQEGYAWVIVTFSGYNENYEQVQYKRIFFVESYVAPNEWSLSRSEVEVYARDSVADDDIFDTTTQIRLTYSNEAITYHNASVNFIFEAVNKNWGTKRVDGVTENSIRLISWQNGNFTISNVNIYDTYMTFDVNGMTTNGNSEITDFLKISYVIPDADNEGRYLFRLDNILTVNVMNADRVEFVNWLSYTEDGIYYELTDLSHDNIVLVMQTSPTNAKNSDLRFYLTNAMGSEANFISVSEIDGNGVVRLNASTGASGYLYVLPEDAINDGVINFMVDGVADSIRLSELGMVRAGYNGTNYDYLVEENNAYFVNNVGKNIYFSKLIVKIPVLVADGMSFDTAYRIYTSEQFADINPKQYYTVMNSINLDNEFASFENISGGIQGDNQDVTITLSGKNIATEISGEVRNISFAGQASGKGFVADKNSGTIKNVSVDVAVTVEDNAQKFSSSTLTAGDIAGGIVGENSGTIDGASVLGLKISADGQIVGGIAGRNSGNITNSRVEFYNFEGGVNTFTGATVGGLVGEMTGGKISRSYAYDYTMKSDSQAVLSGNTVGAFVGKGTDGRVEESFAVVGIDKAVGHTTETNPILIVNSYISYYSDTYTSTYYGENGSVANEESLSSPFITSGSEGFLSYVNGGHAHLDFYQDQPYSGTQSLSINRSEYNGFVQSLGAGNGGVIFFFQPSNMPVDGLNESEERDINSYNSISTADLLGISEEDARKVVITSSNVNVILAQNDGIVVRGVGNVKLTIYSQQDYSNSKTIEVTVIYSMSKLVASYNFAGGSVQITENESGTTEVPLQETKSLRVGYTFEKENVYLGNGAKLYALSQNDIKVEYSALPNDDTGVAIREEVSGKFITLTAGVGDDKTLISAVPVVNGLGTDYQNAVTEVFQSRYTVAPFAGAIRIDATNDEVNMSPGTPGYITAVVVSTNDAERLSANISLGGIDLTISSIENLSAGESGNYSFTASLGTQKRFNVNVSWTRGDKREDGTYEYTFEFYFAVAEEYRNHVSANESYDVTLISNSQIASQEFSLLVSRQEFNNLAVTNYDIRSTTYQKVDGQYLTVYTINPSSNKNTIAPGSASIMQVNVNPAYAYYDSFRIEYQTVRGTGVANAVMLDFLMPSPEDNSASPTEFVRNRRATISQKDNGYNITPTEKDKESGNLYFRAWINDAVNGDPQIEYKITFFANEEEVGYVTYYQKVSYLRDAQISIVGQVGQDGIIAKGETVTVSVTIEDDETVNLDSVVLLNSAGGITRSNITEVASSIPNTRAFEFNVSATVTAKTVQESGEVLPLQISATVSRIENNVPQTKEVALALNLVDFRIDSNNIRLDSPVEGEFVTYVGLPQYLQFEYNFLPAEYTYNESDTESVTAVNALRGARQSLQTDGYYNPSEGMLQNYTINFDVNNNRAIPLVKRLEYYDTSTGLWANVDAGKTLNGIATVAVAEDGTVALEGLQETADGEEIQMRMTTCETVNGVERKYPTLFTVSVEAYSSEDVPKCVYTNEDFMKMAGGKEQNYILMNDLHLTGYVPFDTTNIASFDGNGYTIHIDSFNVIQDNTRTLNLALFKNVTNNTTLKNVRVNIFNGGQILADVSRYSQINIAGFAISNAGIITNCDVVAYATGSYNSSKAYGLNVTYINGSGTTSPVYITPNSTWQTTVSGFVNENSGSITNSRVGGDSVMVVSDEVSKGLYRLTSYNLQTFNISAQGDVAGFVGQNSGKIAASYVKNVEIDNLSEDPDKNTAGFVLTNNGSVITSYIEGVRGEKGADDDKFTNTGSSISSANGIVAGFVYSNEDTAQIVDSYSNILISNVNEGSAAYLAAGFVYANTGYLKNCYSASQVENLKYSQMNFSGVDENGNLMTSAGIYENCYYYNSSYTSSRSTGSTTEEDFNTGAGQLRDVSLASNFYGFAVSTSDSDDAIWKITDEGIKLVEANLLTISHRYYNVIEDGENVVGETGATVGEDGEIITYNMPYSTLQGNGGVLYNSAYGSTYNPILIRSAQEFVEVTGTSQSSSVQLYLKDKKISGTYRLVTDIDLSSLLTSEEEQTYLLPSSSRAFTGIFYGNGFTISNVSITSSESVFSYGLFGTIEKDDTTSNTLDTMILNLNLTVSRVSNNASTTVGALSGYVRDAKLINISATFNDGAIVEGLNFAGGLAGLVFNNSLLSNLSVENATVIADRYDSESPLTNQTLLTLRETLSNSLSGISINKSAYEMTNLKSTLISHSFAGGVAGFVDIFADGERNSGFEATDYSLAKQGQGFNVYGTRVTGNTYVEGNVAGGIFGLTGSKTDVRDARIEIPGRMNENTTHIIATRYYAGGVIGQSFGALSQIVATYSDEVLSTINNNYGTYYANRDMTAERGAIDIFYREDNTNYTQKYIGGLVGYAGSGSMRVSYSTLNVIGLDSDYSGGVIGVIDTDSNVTTYTFNPGGNETNLVSTKYSIEEVYSSGDIRAKNMSGGIVGVIAQPNTNASFAAVNSVNFLSIYDYEKGVNYTNEQLGNLMGPEGNQYYQGTTASTLKFYSIVGQFGTGEAEDETQTDTSTKNEGNYLTFSYVYESYFDDNGIGQFNDFASIGKFNDYNFTSGTKLTLTNTYYPGFNGNSTSADSTSTKTPTFLIETPSSYTDATAGRTYTRAAFLDSNAWSDTNWVHRIGQLYPEIKYADLQEAVLYMDQYNVEQVVNIMNNNPDVEVEVRGLISEDADVNSSSSFGDVYLTQNGKSDGAALQISENVSEGFSGTLRGNTRFDVSLVVKDTIFATTGPGLVLQDLNIVYDGSEAVTGGIVASAINEAQIVNMTLTVKNTPTVSPANDNAGLIAGSITSTSIEGLRIVDNVGSGQSLLNLGQSSDNSSGTQTRAGTAELSVGLIAGQATQSSSVRSMKISQISISLSGSRVDPTNGTVINIDQNIVGGGTLNAGLYFGKVSNSPNISSAFNINLSALSVGQSAWGTSQYAEINITPVFTTVNIGGYIGDVGNITEVSGTFTNRPLNFAVNFASNESTISTLNYGGLIGVSRAQTLELNYTQDSGVTVYNKLTSGDGTTFSIGSMNYGGLIGQVGGEGAGSTGSSGGAPRITGLTAYNSLFGSETNGLDMKTLTKTDNTGEDDLAAPTITNTNGAITFTGTLNYGGLIGDTASGASISKFNGGNNKNLLTFTTETAGTAGTAKTGTIANVGGVVGNSSNGSVSISAVSEEGAKVHDSYNIQADTINAGGLVGNSTGGVNISGKIVNDGSMNIGNKTASTNNVGGFVGSVTGSVDIAGTEENNLSQYTGHIFINNASTANVGGIVGRAGAYGTDGAGALSSASITNTSFGGTIRVASGTTLNSGGTVGYLNVKDIPEETKLSIQYNYSYGDIYISNSIESEDITAGGIIGESTDKTRGDEDPGIGDNISYNYSLVAINSGKHSQDREGVDINALFGTSVKGTSADNNYYNHGVALCTDDFGTDRGYVKAYTDGVSRTENAPYTYTYHAGYGEKYNTGDSLIATFDKEAGLTSTTSGHKLKPAEITNTISGVAYPDNGVYYFALQGDSPINAQLLKNVSQNIAIVGDGYTLTYTGNSESFIPELSGFSYVSSLVLNVNVNLEDTTNTNIGGLVGNMTSGQIYGVGVSGNIEVGGTSVITVAGLVANAGGNVTIRDSYSVADILYRAKDSGSVSGLVGTGGAQIYSSFTGGRLSTYIDANMYAFSQGSHTIENSYTYTTLDWHDHTSEKTEPADTTIISVFGSASVTASSYYDKLALNRTGVAGTGDASEGAMPSETTTDDGVSHVGWGTFSEQHGKLYNFGYPVRSNFKYLAPSSLYTREMSDNSKDGTDNKTRGITEYNYTRLTVGQTLYLENNNTPSGATGENSLADTTGITSANTAYGIPNYTVLTNMIGNEGNGFYVIYVLINDIDNIKTDEEGDKVNWTSATLGVTELDGNGHTINNLGATMFTSLSEKNVRNIRLTNDNDLPLSDAILVQTLGGTTIVSNVTLSGYIESSESKNLAALAGLADGTDITINAVTNLAHVRKTGTNTDNCAGGLIGYVNNGANVTINYSSNYGTIQNDNGSSTAQSDNAKTAHAGGLVGGVGGTLTINNSYNANSVIVNYTKTENGDMTTHAGGLVGWASGKVDISNSYNSGIVKAGNKNVGTNGSSVSYAGGIIGYGTTGSITNCFNEGSIEALGANPTYKYTTSYSYFDTTAYTINIVVVQEENPVNVRPYGIGYINGTMTLSQVSNSGNVEANGRANIYSNEDPTFTEEGTTKHYVVVGTGSIELNRSGIELNTRAYGTNSDDKITVKDRIISLTSGFDRETPESFNDDETTWISKDKLDMPTDIVSKITYQLEIHYSYTGTVYRYPTHSGGLRIPIPTPGTISDTYEIEYDSIVNWNITKRDISLPELTNDSIAETSQVITKDIVKGGDSTTTEDIQTVTINGQNYYLADANNVTGILNAGIYKYKPIEIEFDYISENTRDYVVTITTNDENITVNGNITNFIEREGKKYIEVTLYSQEDLLAEGMNIDVNITIAYDYNNTITVDLSGVNLLFNDQLQSYGVDTNNNSIPILPNARISVGDNTYNNIVRLMDEDTYNDFLDQIDEDDQSSYVLPDDGNSYYYMVMIGDELYYVEEATLKVDERTITVNSHRNQDTTDEMTYFTNKFLGKVFYVVGEGLVTLSQSLTLSEYAYEQIDDKNTLYNESQEVSGSIQAGSDTTGGVTFEISGTQTNTYNSNMDVFVDVNTESLDQGIVYSISNEENNYASLSYIDGQWVMSSTATEGTFVSDGSTYNFTISVEENRLKLHFTGLTIAEDLAGIVASNLGDSLTLEFTQNDVTQTVEEDVLECTPDYKEVITQYDYEFNLTSTTQDEFIILGDDNQTPIVARSATGTGTWFVANGVKIGGNTYTITANPDGISLSITSSSDLELNALKSDIETFFSARKMIEEKTLDDSIISDNFGNAWNGEKTVIDKNGLKVVITHDKKWETEGDGNENFTFSPEGGRLRVALNKDSGIYTLGDVSIQYGTFAYNVKQICKTTAVSATYDSGTTTAVAGLTVADEHDENMTGNISITLDKEKIAGLIGSEGTYSLNVLAEIYPTTNAELRKNSYIIMQYNSGRLSYMLQIALGNLLNGNIYLEEATFGLDMGEETIYTFLAQLSNDLENNLITVEFSNSNEENEQDTFITMYIDISSEQYQIIYERMLNSDGTINTNPEKELFEELPEEIVINSSGVSINKSDFNIMVEALNNKIKTTLNGGIKVFNNVVYFKNQSIFNDLNGTDAIALQYTQETASTDGNPLNLPNSRPVQTSISDIEDLIISDDLKSLIVASGLNQTESIMDVQNFIDTYYNDKTFNFQAKNSSLPNLVYLIFDYTKESEGTSVELIRNEENEYMEPLPIIFTKDIILYDSVNEFYSLKENVSISGDNYYLSFWRNDGKGGLYTEGNGEFIKDLNILVETTDNFVLPGDMTYRNISTYGILGTSGVQGSSYSIFGSDPEEISDFENHMSIISADGNDSQGTNILGTEGISITIVKNQSKNFDNFINYGTLLAGDGGDGYRGNDGTSDSKNGEKGSDGGKGGSIILNCNNPVVNSGLVYSGNGGNGGAGGTGYHGTHHGINECVLEKPNNLDSILAKEDSSYYKAGDAGAGGVGGSAGEVDFGNKGSEGFTSKNGGRENGGFVNGFNIYYVFDYFGVIETSTKDYKIAYTSGTFDERVSHYGDEVDLKTKDWDGLLNYLEQVYTTNALYNTYEMPS